METYTITFLHIMLMTISVTTMINNHRQLLQYIEQLPRRVNILGEIAGDRVAVPQFQLDKDKPWQSGVKVDDDVIR